MMRTECVDCGVDTNPTAAGLRAEFYMVTDATWASSGAPDGCLCVGCIEARLARRLAPADFTDVRLNDLSIVDSPRWAYSWRTDRLRSRMTLTLSLT